MMRKAEIFYVSTKSLEQTHQKAMRQVAPKEFDMVQVFLNNRKRAKEFVDNHGLHHAEKAFERAEAMADRTCDSLEGEDIEQDCQILYVRALANLNIHYERAETENERFVFRKSGPLSRRCQLVDPRCPARGSPSGAAGAARCRSVR